MDVTIGLHYLFLSHILLLLVTVGVTIRLLNPRRFQHKFSIKSGEKSTRKSAFLNLDKIHENMPEGERKFVVFLSGFRVHSWTKIIVSQLKSLLKFNRYTGIVLKPKDRMPNYEDGCIGSFKYGSLLGDVIMVQYWRSFEHLSKFAKKRDHVSATRHYEKTLNERGYIGGWHETFLVNKGDYESLYFNMPPHMMSSLPSADVEAVGSRSEDGVHQRSTFPCDYESLYFNMPPHMMSSLPAADVEVVEVDRKTKTAKKRRMVAMDLNKHMLHTTPASNSSELSAAQDAAERRTSRPESESTAESERGGGADHDAASSDVVSIQVES